MSDLLDLREEPYDGPTAQALIAAVQLEYVARYGSPDDAPIDVAEFTRPRGLFLVGYAGDEPVASGGLRSLGDGVAEIKRMFVAPSWRGRGMSRQVLAGLERLAPELGASRIVLETGLVQPEAISLYETSGYTRIDGYGHYACAPLSISFGKHL